MHFRKLPPKVVRYRDFKKLDNERFMDSLQHTLGQESFDWSKNPGKFFEICQTIFNTHALKKKKYKLLYNKQRNYCVSLLRKEKKETFARLNENDITDNRKFWHAFKPFLSDKVKSRKAIILVDNENIKSNENEFANTFNDFFSNIVNNLKIPEY